METRKELELLLLGMALHTETREAMLKEISPIVLSPEIGVLFESLQQPEKGKPLMDWLEARGAKPSKGRNAREAVLDAIYKMNAKLRLKNQARVIEKTLKIGTNDQIIHALQAALDAAKELQEVESA
jgi:hypothetical protein